MFGFQNVCLGDGQSDNIFEGVNLRRVRSDEAIYTRLTLENLQLEPPTLHDEEENQRNSTSERFYDCQSTFFWKPMQNFPNLAEIPLPPTPPSSYTNENKQEALLAPRQSVPNIQKRYYFKENASGNPSPEVQAKKAFDDLADVLKMLSKRTWQDVIPRKKKASSKSYFEFTLMSYNVLAQDLVRDHPYLYKFHNRKALKWETRWKNLLNEIKTLKPDVLCLQEVQESHLPTYYSQLFSLGYQALYKKRTGIRCDGCAIYYRPDRIQVVEYETVEFFQPNIPVLNRDNIAIIAKLCPRHKPEKHFVVATTHLLYNPKRQDVRLAQTQLLLTEVERMSFYKNSKGNPKYRPIIITGDFNSTPDSAVYELITKGTLKYDHLTERRLDKPGSPRHGNILVPSSLQITDKCQHACLLDMREKNKEISRMEEAALIKLHNSFKQVPKAGSETTVRTEMFSTGTLSHLFTFKSVYQHGDVANPEGTTFQDEWITVDYIFYSAKRKGDKIDDHKLKLQSVYRLPCRDELGSLKIPNTLLGSDHLSLVAKFKLKI